MQRRLTLQRDAIPDSVPASISPGSRKETSRFFRNSHQSNGTLSVSPLSGFRDVTNFTVGDSSLELRQARRQLEATRVMMQRNKEDLRKSIKNASSLDQRVRKNRMNQVRAELMSLKSDRSEKSERSEKSDLVIKESKDSRLQLARNALDFGGKVTRPKSSTSVNSRAERNGQQRAQSQSQLQSQSQSQPMNQHASSHNRINQEMLVAAAKKTKNPYNSAEKKPKKRFTEAIKTEMKASQVPKRKKMQYQRKPKTLSRRQILKDFWDAMSMNPRIVKISVTADEAGRVVERVRYGRLLAWMGEALVCIEKDGVLLQQV